MKPLNPPIRDWVGKRVWIVGASSGIGEALARELARRGARLCLSARNAERLQKIEGELPDAFSIPLDVADVAGWSVATQTLMQRWQAVDVVVLNAGCYVPIRAWQLSAELARKTIDTNVLGVMYGVAAVLPAMLAASAGHIVVVSSVAAYGGLPRALVYGASKSALHNFSETLYLDVASRGVGVTLVSPGFVATPLTAGNDFKMPALISVERAVQYMLDGLARGAFEIHFPRRFSVALKVLRYLPYRLYFWLVRKGTGL